VTYPLRRVGELKYAENFQFSIKNEYFACGDLEKGIGVDEVAVTTIFF
jgi:hypothetical protein